MARQQNIGGNTDLFIGEDKTLEFEIYSSDETTIQNVTGFALAFQMRKRGGADTVVLTCTTGASSITITGSYNSVASTNTQRANVIIADTDTDNLTPGLYDYSLRRTDAGNETVIAFGEIRFKKAA